MLFRSKVWRGSQFGWFLSLLLLFTVLTAITIFYPLSDISRIRMDRFVRYLLWALVQQYLICVVVGERLNALTKNAWLSAYLCATAFALLHTPNATLMLATFLGELFWCRIYLHDKGLIPITLSHAMVATLLTATLPITVLRSIEVSARYFFN